MNDIMSFGIHRLWKKYYVDLLLDKFNKKEKILDIASGSGDIFHLFPYKNNLYAIDPIEKMHEISKEKNFEKKLIIKQAMSKIFHIKIIFSKLFLVLMV